MLDKGGGGRVAHGATWGVPAHVSDGNVSTRENSPKVYKRNKSRTDKKKENGERKIALRSKTIRLSSTMVVATETGEGDMTAIVGGMYDGQFGRVRGYTKHSVKLTLVHGLARPWAKRTANVKVTVRKTSVRVLNLNEVERVATWEKGVMARKEGRSWVELCLGDDDVSGAFRQLKPNPGPEAEMLAKLVALHINTHGCLAFQERLNGAMAQGPLNE